jgi:hypothetical protein
MTVLLRRKTYDQSDDRAGQDDFQVIATLHQRYQKRQKRADENTK